MKENGIISPEIFSNVIKKIKEADKKSHELSKALESYLCTSSYCYVDMHAELQETLIKLLYEVFKVSEKEDVIGWWLYEDVNKVYYYPDGFELKLETVDELYNYLVNHEEIDKEHGKKSDTTTLN